MCNLQGLDVQRRRQGLLQLLGLGGVVDNQGVLVSGTSDLELGLLEWLAVGVDLLVDLDNSRLDVSSSSQFDEFLDVLDFFLEVLVEDYGGIWDGDGELISGQILNNFDGHFSTVLSFQIPPLCSAHAVPR